MGESCPMDMERDEDADALRLVVVFLRFHADLTQAQFGEAAGVDQGLISQYEAGRRTPSEESLRRMATAVGVPWSLVVYLRRFYSSMLEMIARRTKGVFGVEPLETGISEALERTLLTVATHLAAESRLWESKPLTPEKERREAEEIWAGLKAFSMSRRRRLLELSLHARRSWALAERICEASRQTAASDPKEALGLANLALFIAEQVPDKDGWRSRVEGYCWAHIANARRAANDPTGAAEAFARAWDLWRAGAISGSDLLPESRLLDLERPVS